MSLGPLAMALVLSIPRRRPAVLVFSVGLVCLASAGAGQEDFGKKRSTPPTVWVGSLEPVSVVPDLRSPGRRTGGAPAWSHTFEIPEASFLKAHLVDVNLRAGDVLRVLNGQGRAVEEITGRGPREMGSFWTLSAFGPRLVLEIRSDRPYPHPPLRIDRLLVGDEEIFRTSPTGEKTVCSEPDFEDAICYQTDVEKWKNIQATVGIMTIDGSPNGAIFCTGSNVSGPGHILTNAHCIENQAQCNGSEIIFGFHRTTCGAGLPTTEWRSFRCGTVVATSTFSSCDATLDALDFTLVSVIGDPTTDFAMAIADGTNPLNDGEALYIVQHPRSRPKEITHGSGVDVLIDDIVLRYYGSLDTDIGSSGSPIFRQSDGRLVGLHHCGGCDGPEGNRGTAMTEILPHIEEHLCTENLTLSGGGIQDLQEILGNGNGIIDVGETWQFRPRIRNTSCELAATEVTAEIQIGSRTGPGVTLLDSQAAFGDIAAGQAAASVQAIRFAVDETASCGGSVILDLVQVAATNGGSFPDTFAVIDQSIGELVKTTLFFDDFLAGFDAGWTVVDGGTGSGDAATWTTENPAQRLIPLLEPFALADSDELGIGEMMDEELISPVIDTSGYLQVELQLAHQFNWYPLGLDEQGDIDIRSPTTGNDWINVANFSGERREGTNSFDITPWAAGQSAVQIRFHYYNARFEWWWAVDDLYLLGNNGFVCHPFSSTIFADSFESGDTGGWTAVVGVADGNKLFSTP